MPPVEFVTGTLAGLEDALAAAIDDAKRDDALAPVTVLAGHTLLKRYLPRMLALRGRAHINVRFVLSHELAADLSPRGADPEARLTQSAERLLVRQVGAAASGYFAEIAHGEGFVDALLALFREFERGGFGDPKELEAGLAASATSDNPAKLRELASLYVAYIERRATAGFTGFAEAYAAADPARLDGDLLVHGLWDPPEMQLRLLERIAAERKVTVFLPASGLDADEAHAAFRERLGGTTRTIPGDATDVAPIARVASRLFAPIIGGEPIVTDDVALVSAPDTVREVWEAARACLRWAEDGIAFHEMAVVYRNQDPYRALVAEIFAEAGMDAYVHDGRPVAEHPLGRRLLALLDLAADDEFSRQKVMEFLTETRVPAATIDRAGRFTPSLWESFTREAGVVAGIEQWRARLARLAAEKRSRAQDERFEWQAGVAVRIEELVAFIDEFHAAITRRAATATWDEHLAFLRDLASLYADDVEPVLGALADLRGLGAIEPRPSFDAFCRAVRDDLERRDASAVFGEPERSFGRNGVAVIDASSLRHLRFRAVYVLGVAERAWPPPLRPDPLLLEHERERLNAAGAGKMPLRTSPDSETLTYWMAAQAARERLAISFARADAGSTSKHVPSYFFRAVGEALTGGRLTLAGLDASGVVRRLATGRLACERIDDSLTAPEYDRGLVRDMLDGIEPASVAALARESPSFDAAIASRRQRWDSGLSSFDGVMESEDARAYTAGLRFALDRPVSPSRLEMYAECPYRYFMRYVINVEPLDEPETVDRIDALERGSLIHAILERFLDKLGRDDPPRPEARARHIAKLLEVAYDEGRKREARGVTGRALLWQFDQRKIHIDLERWYDAEVEDAAGSTLRPGAFEAGFGGARFGIVDRESPLSSADPLLLRAGGRDVLLQGRIDRIDWDDARTRFRVIDYKTGQKRGHAAFDGGHALQLPIYLRAASHLLDIDPADGEAQYFYVSTKEKFARTKITGDELAERGGDFELVLSTIVSGVDGGFFAPHPGEKKKNCGFCDYRDVCDARIDRIMDRKAGDPRGAAYISMTEIE